MTDWPRFLAIYGKEQTFALRLTHVSRTKAVYKRDKVISRSMWSTTRRRISMSVLRRQRKCLARS